ncbi:hypothetical protein C1Y40_00641 [Mycobacterium talmoniae]|uniref:Uncharacterized protein n=1 Tax=Mycobacterium talmoniae TaxID=1858794 RepID=A0A2S8BR81_9MYCO|nr:hypothetical protein C1Y40_00641 [Mycobacterium talmoniae]
MPIDPTAIGATTEPTLFEWTDRDTMLYALGVGAGTEDLAYTTDNSHGIAQQVLPTYAVICCMGFAAAAKIGDFDFSQLLHGSQQIRLFAPLPPAGRLSVVAEVADIQDKGEGKNAIVMLRARGTDPTTQDVIAETLTTAVIRGAGASGSAGAAAGRAGDPGARPRRAGRLPHPRRPGALYRLSGDRNPAATADPWFAQTLAGFPKPILHGLCSYGFAGRAVRSPSWPAVRPPRSPASRRVSARRCSPARR